MQCKGSHIYKCGQKTTSLVCKINKCSLTFSKSLCFHKHSITSRCDYGLVMCIGLEIHSLFICCQPYKLYKPLSLLFSAFGNLQSYQDLLLTLVLLFLVVLLAQLPPIHCLSVLSLSLFLSLPALNRLMMISDNGWTSEKKRIKNVSLLISTQFMRCSRVI